MNSKNFGELKRRNVYKVAVAYAVVGWLAIQICSTVLPTFHAPEWVVQTLVVLVAVGFPIALVLAWAFEITPEGIKRAEDVDPKQSMTGKSGRKLVGITVALAIIAAGLLALQLFRAKSTSTAAPSASPAQSTSASSPIPEKLIAVLPFDNLSEEKGNAFFAEGIQEEILTRLAKVADLKVISRTSTQRFKAAPSDLREIAKQLGVTNILEGSVQKSNDHVRINVQLINAVTDAHLWADIYDRKLTDLFTVESEVAKTIADTLQAKLTGSEMTAMSSRPTEDAVAHELFVQGRHFLALRRDDNLPRAIGFFHQAIARDPNYAAAYAGLSEALILLPRYTGAYPSETRPQSRVAALKALELNPNLAEAHNALAKIALDCDVDFAESIREFKRAIELNPNYAGAHHSVIACSNSKSFSESKPAEAWASLEFGDGPLMALARSDRSIEEGKRAVGLDPLSLINNADLGWDYFNARRYDEAIAKFRKTIEIDSYFYLTHYYLGEAFLLKGKLTEAIAEYRTAVELNDEPIALALLGQAYARAGRRDEAQKILARLTQEAKSRYVSGYSFALVLTGLGDKEGAIDALERAYRNGEGNDIYIIRVDPLLDDLRGHPRFEALAEKILPAREFNSQSTASK